MLERLRPLRDLAGEMNHSATLNAVIPVILGGHASVHLVAAVWTPAAGLLLLALVLGGFAISRLVRQKETWGYLDVVSGREAVKEFSLRGNRVSIGREPDTGNWIQCFFDDQSVSRKQGVLTRRRGEVYFENHSAHGTIVDGVRIGPGEEALVRTGAAIELGSNNAILRYRPAGVRRATLFGGETQFGEPLPETEWGAEDVRVETLDGLGEEHVSENGRTPLPRVFISHSNLDNEFTEGLVADLKKLGAEVWVDFEQIASGDFAASINSGLGSCEWVVLVMTPNAIESPWVTNEINAAVNLYTKKKRVRGVIPLVARDCTHVDVPPIWDALHSYDATRDYAKAVNGLAQAIGLTGRL